jgi:hypothetical protein
MEPTEQLLGNPGSGNGRAEVDSASHLRARIDLTKLDWDVSLALLLGIDEELLRLQISVSELPIAARAHRVLGELRIHSVQALLKRSIRDLIAVRSMGARSVESILFAIRSRYDGLLAPRKLPAPVEDAQQTGDVPVRRALLYSLVNDWDRRRYMITGAYQTEFTEVADARSTVADVCAGTVQTEPIRLTDEIVASGTPQLVTQLQWDVQLRALWRRPLEAPPDTPVGLLDLSVRAANGVARLRLATVGDLLSVTISALMRERHMGVRSVWNIIARLNALADPSWRSELASGVQPTPLTGEWPSESRLRVETQLECPVLEATHKHIERLVLALPTRAGKLLFDMIASMLRPKDRSAINLLKIPDIAGLLSIGGDGSAQGVHLRRRILSVAEALVPVVGRDDVWPVADSDAVSRYYRWATNSDLPHRATGILGRYIATILASKPKLAEVALARFNAFPKGLTLDEVGDEIGVTRERARQLISRAVEVLQEHPGFGTSVVGHVMEVMERHHGVMAAHELAAALFHDGDPQFIAGSPWFLRFAASLPEWATAGLEMTGSVVRVSRIGVELEALLNRVVVDAAKRSADDFAGPNLWSAPLDRVLTEVTLIVNGDNKTRECDVNVSGAALRRAIDDRKESIKADSERVYSLTYWQLLGRGSRLQQVEGIVYCAARPMHHVEISAELKRWSRKDLGSGAGGALERSESVVCWGRGTYMHRAWIQLPHGLLNEIADWIAAKLTPSVPYVSVAGAFDFFEGRCAASGIPNGQALYSALRIECKSRFRTNEYPYITHLRVREARQPVNLLIEDYVRDEGGFVPRKKLIEYLTGALGVDTQLVPMHIATAPNLLSAHANVIHVDNLVVDYGALSELARACTAELTHRAQVSVREIVKSRRVTCVRLGVDDTRLIHSLLVHYSEGKLAGTYPHIALANAGAMVRSVPDLVAHWLRDRDRPCSLVELKQHFVEGMGFGEQSVHAATNQQRIARYSTGAVVHLDVIGWNPDKQRCLEAIAVEQYSAARARGNLCATASELLEQRDDELPAVGRLVWTRTLVSTLLHRGTTCVFPGTAKDAYVPAQNDLRICTLDDYVAQYLLRFHSGACSLETLEEELREGGVIVKHLTQQMLGVHSLVLVDRGSVLLRRLQHA